MWLNPSPCFATRGGQYSPLFLKDSHPYFFGEIFGQKIESIYVLANAIYFVQQRTPICDNLLKAYVFFVFAFSNLIIPNDKLLAKFYGVLLS